jgi:hypothetical protein
LYENLESSLPACCFGNGIPAPEEPAAAAVPFFLPPRLLIDRIAAYPHTTATVSPPLNLASRNLGTFTYLLLLLLLTEPEHFLLIYPVQDSISTEIDKARQKPPTVVPFRVIEQPHVSARARFGFGSISSIVGLRFFEESRAWK